VGNHKKNPNAEISVYGQEKTAETVRLCKMNLAVHGLSGDIREGNSYYEDIHKSVGKFDFVMANSASDARGSEQDIRKSLIEDGAVDVMVAVGSNFFYTVTLPCTLWFLDRGAGLEPEPGALCGSGRARG
jgi:type I restriction enzyme M protein